ncbi:MAG: hypothetical protein Q9197_002160 [Variospora fuerteventurae]
MDSPATPTGIRRKDTLRSRGPPLRILSFDGGGVRGYSSLLLLEQFMQQVVNLCNEEPPESSDMIRPCEYFDLIGGTGTGGLIAIMLGRLRMTLGQCMEIFKEMTEVVFETDKTIAGLPYKSTLFKASKLEDAIRACVQEYEKERLDKIHGPPGSPTRAGSMSSYRTTLPQRRSSLSNPGGQPSRPPMTSRGNPNALMYDPRKHRTKTAVTAVLRGARGGTNVLLRSYPSQNERTIEPNCTIWQVGRATCATGFAFKPIQIGTSVFHDQGTGHFNPSREMLDEAVLNEWPGREIGMFVSIGCGLRQQNESDNQRQWWESMASDLAEAQRRLNEKIDGCNLTHEAMIGDGLEKRTGYLAYRGVNPDHYLRLNVEKGVGDFKMNNYRAIRLMNGSTESYLQTPAVRAALANAANRMWELHCHRTGQMPYTGAMDSGMHEDSAPAYHPSLPSPHAAELPGEDPPSLYPRPLSRPGPQYPAAYARPFEQIISTDDKFTMVSSDEAPQVVDFTPRISEDSSFRPSSELYGSDAHSDGYPRRSHDSVPPPLPPKTPIPYYDDPRRHTVPHRMNHHMPLPYPDTDGPPPMVNMARKPQFIQR